MSAFLDALSGAGYDGSEEGGLGQVGSGNVPITMAATAEAGGGGGAGYFSGLLQSATALGTGYLAKRMDIDLYSRAAGAQAYPQLGTTQNGLLIRQAGVPQSGGVTQVAGRPAGATLLNLNALLPYLLVAGAVFFIAKRAG